MYVLTHVRVSPAHCINPFFFNFRVFENLAGSLYQNSQLRVKNLVFFYFSVFWTNIFFPGE